MKGRDVRRARRLLGLSQPKFAIQLGLSGQLISNIEVNREVEVRHTTRLAIERVLIREGKWEAFEAFTP